MGAMKHRSRPVHMGRLRARSLMKAQDRGTAAAILALWFVVNK